MEQTFTSSEQNLIIAALMVYGFKMKSIAHKDKSETHTIETINAVNLENKCRDLWYADKK